MVSQTNLIQPRNRYLGWLQRNVDFYAGTLGLRLVKTINFDFDPRSYHFYYYGDGAGSPGK